jgi:hypothetical protein
MFTDPTGMNGVTDDQTNKIVVVIAYLSIRFVSDKTTTTTKRKTYHGSLANLQSTGGNVMLIDE